MRCTRCSLRGPRPTWPAACTAEYNRPYPVQPRLRSPPRRMIRSSRSKAAGDLIMMGLGDQVLRIIGREPAPRDHRAGRDGSAIAALGRAVAGEDSGLAAQAEQRRRSRAAAGAARVCCASARRWWRCQAPRQAEGKESSGASPSAREAMSRSATAGPMATAFRRATRPAGATGSPRVWDNLSPHDGLERDSAGHAVLRADLPRLRRAQPRRRRQQGRPRGAVWCLPRADFFPLGDGRPAARCAASPRASSPAASRRAAKSSRPRCTAPRPERLHRLVRRRQATWRQYFRLRRPFPPFNDSLVHHYVFTLYALNVAQAPVDGRRNRAPQVGLRSTRMWLAEATCSGTTLNRA